MTNDEIRIKCAELCGWKDIQSPCQHCRAEIKGVIPGGGDFKEIPNYPLSLDACAEMEEHLETEKEVTDYCDQLHIAVGADINPSMMAIFATAKQRCLAFIAVKEGK